jgi:SHS2 domain-containing protein
MSRSTGHRQLDHTADLALELWAPSQELLLDEAARALIGIVAQSEPGRATARRTLTITALDGADRLVRWMNEILNLALVEGFLTVSTRITLQGDGGLRAELRGETDALDRVVTELKSVTYHDLALEPAGGAWRARVVIDV